MDSRPNHLIIAHPTEPRALLLRSGDAWALPHAAVAEHSWRDMAPLLPAVLARFGLRTTALRCLAGPADGAGDVPPSGALYLLESRDLALPGEARWIDGRDLASITLHRPEHRAALETWLAEDQSGALPQRRSPWARRGWFAGAADWIAARMADLGLPATGPIEPVQLWSLSTILRCPTTEGAVYFKAAAPHFFQEAAITQALAALYPTLVPDLLAADRERNWMLLRDFGDDRLFRAAPDERARALTAFAALQRDSAGRVPALYAAGFLDRGLPVLAAGIDRLLADPVTMEDLDQREMDQLEALAPRLREWCARLADFGVPDALLHGDLHQGNIVVTGRGPLIFDWTDGCISHPFLDLATFLTDFPTGLIDGWSDLRDRYLQAWTAYAPLARLREACALALPLGMLYQAISYQQILASIEDSARWEMSGSIGFWLRALLAFVEQPDTTTSP